jgi:exodeoxyribonuclease V gamma subunit
MTTLSLFTSNRLEILVETLAEVLSRPLASPLDEEIVVVQSKGMERWVSAELARRHGICANVRFPFPNAFVFEIFRTAIQDLPETAPFDPKILTWRLMKLLPTCIARPGFESLKTYLRESGAQLKRFQLSERIADTFDQYLLFRPEMMLSWEKSTEDHWQAVLWRELVRGSEALTQGRKTGHRARLGKAFLEALKGASHETPETIGLPERVSVFGISALPRFHMQILAGLSHLIQVNLFLMNPCKAYWGDIVSDWEMKRTIDRKHPQEITAEELHLEKGNSLLASMGTLGRDFFDLVNELECQEVPAFEDPGENTLLSAIQSDILNLRDADQGSKAKRPLAQDDTSIQIHSCHSPMREIEVLHDRLLEIFEESPGLLPKDVLVMAPDIEAYAPYIQAVFDLPADDCRRFPFTIADRSVRKESQIVDTFLSLLDLCGSRFGSAQVLALLESRAVQQKFGLSDADLDLVRRWVKETGIRWGIDGQGRSKLGLPAFSENTWKAGLERLLLGYAMPGFEEHMFEGVLPYDQIEGNEASVLGRFLSFADGLFTRVTSLDRPKTLSDWANALTDLLEGFFVADENTENQMHLIRRMLRDVGETQEMSGFDEKVDISVIKSYVRKHLQREGFGFGFIVGGVTFCAMLPMRSIPFKVICLVGMDSDAYPRQSKPLSFDLMARDPKPGDRSRRRDDRYLFLEAILSARERLYVSYVGQSIQDNSPVPPSVLVSELMDYIEQGFEIEGGKIRDRIVTKHRLQAFSPEYFKGNKQLFSYSEVNRQAAGCLLECRQPPTPFLSQGLSDPEEEWRRVDLEQLSRFFNNPARFLLNTRLGIYLEERASILEDREAFEIKGLEKYLLEQRLVEWEFSGRDLADYLPVARASGQLPHGAAGECVYDSLMHGVKRFVEMTEPFMQERSLEPLEVDLKISGFTLTGRIDSLYPDRLIHHRYAKVKPKDRLRLWLHHLVLNSLRADDYPLKSMLVGLRPTGTEPGWTAWEFSPLEESRDILGNLLKTYWQGLIRPVHLFPRASWEYADVLLQRNKSEQKALDRARSTWTGSDYHPGECEDAYFRLSFRDRDPLDSEFQEIAIETFGPLLASQKDVEP